MEGGEVPDHDHTHSRQQTDHRHQCREHRIWNFCTEQPDTLIARRVGGEEVVTTSVADAFSGREESDKQTESVDEEQDARQEG